MRKQDGITGIDIVISIVIITIFISIIAVLTFNIQRNNEEIKRKAEATSYAIDIIEEIKGNGFKDLPQMGEETIDKYPDGYILNEDKTSATPYYQQITVEDYNKYNNNVEPEYIKIVTVKVIYKVGKNEENVEISTAITKEE